MTTITEAEFIKLCDEIYADRQQIYEFNPGACARDVLLWMLLGCLLSLLSISEAEQLQLDEQSSADPYGDAIRAILQTRMKPRFDPQAQLAELSKKLESEEA